MSGWTNLVIIVFLAALPLECSARSFCGSSGCKDNKQLCKYQETQNPARHCINLEKTINTENDKKAILNQLNNRRNKVAAGEIRSLPAAESMLKLEWNTKLETAAQRWANQCVKHNVPDIKDACRDLEGVVVGQNIATVFGESPGLLPTALVDIWYMELLLFNASVLPCFKESNEGSPHYNYFTQLVWSNTREVGCGGVKFQERFNGQDESNNRTVYRLVCNFAPSGNIENKSVYSQGPPCSKCPKETSCDSVNNALCSYPYHEIRKETPKNNDEIMLSSTILPSVIIDNHINQLVRNSTSPLIQVEDNLNVSVTDIDDENFTPFDYFSHLHDFTRQAITMTTPTSNSECKDKLAVDEFIEILRKKLSSDPILKEMILSTKIQGFTESSFTDESVAAFINKIYSKTQILTTARNTENDLLNSTLLFDLVEAVIFRNSDRISSEYTKQSTQPMSDVSPVKIQAELASVQQNEDFAGHYFFPEEEEKEDETGTSETSESYYDSPNLSIADVLMEIEQIRKSAVTKNFLDEILELEPSPETTASAMMLSPDNMNAHVSGHEVLKKFLGAIKENTSSTSDWIKQL